MVALTVIYEFNYVVTYYIYSGSTCDFGPGLDIVLFYLVRLLCSYVYIKRYELTSKGTRSKSESCKKTLYWLNRFALVFIFIMQLASLSDFTPYANANEESYSFSTYSSTFSYNTSDFRKWSNSRGCNYQMGSFGYTCYFLCFIVYNVQQFLVIWMFIDFITKGSNALKFAPLVQRTKYSYIAHSGLVIISDLFYVIFYWFGYSALVSHYRTWGHRVAYASESLFLLSHLISALSIIYALVPVKTSQKNSDSDTSLKDNSKLSSVQQQSMRAEFDRIDTDGTGAISYEELAQVLTILNLPDKKIAEVFSKLDADGNGEITFEEFGVLWKHFGAVLSQGTSMRDLIGKNEQVAASKGLKTTKITEKLLPITDTSGVGVRVEMIAS
jgi:hypothetical protein